MDIVLKNTKAYLEGFANNELIRYFLESYNTDRPRGEGKYTGVTSRVEASGRGGESLEVKAEDDSINLYGAQYLKYVDEGTGKFQPNISALKRWITEKPVNLDGVKGKTLESKVNTLAFLIGRSIGAKGIAPANFIGEVVERALKEIKDSIGEPLKSDIMEDLGTFMISLGYIKKGNTYELKK
jgi:hypothetical protein